MENGEVANGAEQANGVVKADKESETEKACLIEPEAEVECFKKDFFEGINRILCSIYAAHGSLSTVNWHKYLVYWRCKPRIQGGQDTMTDDRTVSECQLLFSFDFVCPLIRI